MPTYIKPIGGKDILSKRVPKPTKYQDVAAKVSTGWSENKAREIWGEARASKFMREENFRRIRCITLRGLLENPAIVDFLLLDLREVDEYDKCHIDGAVSYPARRFSHQTQPFSPEILSYRNREPEKCIILYDEADHVLGIQTANLLYEKGIDNVFLLTGGLRKFSREHPVFIAGDIPDAFLLTTQSKNSTRGMPTRHMRTRGGGPGSMRGGSYGAPSECSNGSQSLMRVFAQLSVRNPGSSRGGGVAAVPEDDEYEEAGMSPSVGGGSPSRFSRFEERASPSSRGPHWKPA